MFLNKINILFVALYQLRFHGPSIIIYTLSVFSKEQNSVPQNLWLVLRTHESVIGNHAIHNKFNLGKTAHRGMRPHPALPSRKRRRDGSHSLECEIHATLEFHDSHTQDQKNLFIS